MNNNTYTLVSGQTFSIDFSSITSEETKVLGFVLTDGDRYLKYDSDYNRFSFISIFANSSIFKTAKDISAVFKHPDFQKEGEYEDCKVPPKSVIDILNINNTRVKNTTVLKIVAILLKDIGINYHIKGEFQNITLGN